MRYKDKILYDKKVIPLLAERFKVSRPTIRNAFRFATEGEQPDLIREIACKEYGCVRKRIPVLTSNN